MHMMTPARFRTRMQTRRANDWTTTGFEQAGLQPAEVINCFRFEDSRSWIVVGPTLLLLGCNMILHSSFHARLWQAKFFHQSEAQFPICLYCMNTLLLGASSKGFTSGQHSLHILSIRHGPILERGMINCFRFEGPRSWIVVGPALLLLGCKMILPSSFHAKS